LEGKPRVDAEKQRHFGEAEDSNSMNTGNLLYWAVALIIVAIVAALLGFGGVAGTAMEGARILFWVAIALLVILAVMRVARRS
jgi:uncharacterized membrane protein YtjA (UPF0391 family)